MHQQHLHFFQRTFPSANMIVLHGPRPILVDTGFGTDYNDTCRLLADQNINPAELQFIVNTHFHCDHIGGNHAFQRDYTLPIAAHRWEANLVNRRDPETGSLIYLDQAVEPYVVNQLLSDGDVLDTGLHQWQVIHSPGHTQGHIALYCDGFLIAGDTVHADDVAWMNPFREGIGCIDRMLETLDMLAALPLKRSFSGHGPITENPLAQLDYARTRYEKWLQQPAKVAWHAMKRIFVYALMLFDGMHRNEIAPYLLSVPWYHDYCAYIWGVDPEGFVDDVLAELMRAKATEWRGDVLYPTAAYNPPPQGWLQVVSPPAEWPT